MNNHPRLEKALDRILLELNNCILKRRAYNKLIDAKVSHGLNFFQVAAAALQNDIYAGAHRAFDNHKDAASFWYICNIAKEHVADAEKESGIQIEEIRRLSDKLKPIRDRVHSHIQRGALDDP